MELLFQTWDELDDAVAALRHVVARHAIGETSAVARAALAAFARRVREAIAERQRRRGPRVRTA